MIESNSSNVIGIITITGYGFLQLENAKANHVLLGIVGAHGWLVTPAVSLFFDGQIVSSYRGRFVKAPPFGELQNLNRMTFDAMDNLIRLPCWLLVREFGSKLFVFSDISSGWCSCGLPNCGQALCCLLFLSSC
uniref:Uncharacterized protein n=1 Tax=Fagus sylvatica TaxID=28930 RepID=A0A2N9GLD3_FAGSY